MQRCFQSLVLAGILSAAACGGDATAPPPSGTLSPQDALASLARGWGALGTAAGSPGTGLTLAMLPIPGGPQAPLSEVRVTVDGVPVQMFGIAQRVVYPAGTCLETLFGISSFANPGSCTSPPGAVALVLWQAGSASRPPDRLIVMLADVGTSQFASLSSIEPPFVDSGAFPALAFYMDAHAALWAASSGSITSAVTSTGQGCTTLLPPFAKSATCSLASFSESGSLIFAPLDSGVGAATGTHSVTISAQLLNGVIQTVTATAPIPIPTG